MSVARLIRSRWLWLAGALLILGGLIVAADRLWPLPLKEVNPARVVVDEKGTPLWRFADSEGIWRYPVTIEAISSGRVDVKSMVTHIYDYRDVQQAFEESVNNKRDIIKGVIKISD